MIQISSHGGLKAIVISHPHFYTTSAVWARTFDCPVYTSLEDREWFCRNPEPFISFVEPITQQITPSTTAIKLGGHFDGSLILLWKDHPVHCRHDDDGAGMNPIGS